MHLHLASTLKKFESIQARAQNASFRCTQLSLHSVPLTCADIRVCVACERESESGSIHGILKPAAGAADAIAARSTNS